MDNFAIDLDSVLNDFERQESEDESKLEKSLPKVSEKSPNNFSNDPTDESQQDSLMIEKISNSSSSDLENELNDIIMSSVVNDKSMLEQADFKESPGMCIQYKNDSDDTNDAIISNDKTSSLDETIISDSNEISEVNNKKNEQFDENKKEDKVPDIITNNKIDNNSSDGLLNDDCVQNDSDNKNTEEDQLKNLHLNRTESIEIDSEHSESLKFEIGCSKSIISDLKEDSISSPNEDSQTFFDTIESPSNLEKTFEMNTDSRNSFQDKELKEDIKDLVYEINSKIETDLKLEEEMPCQRLINTTDNIEQEPTNSGLKYQDESLKNYDEIAQVVDCQEHLTDNQQNSSENLPEDVQVNEALANNEIEPENQKENEVLDQEKSHSSLNVELVQNDNNSISSQAAQNEIDRNTPPKTSNETAIEITDFNTEWSKLTENEKMLGIIAPTWLNDQESDSCMKCSIKFSFRKRRHHCRACGFIFCSNCCHLKLTLPYTLSYDNNSSEYESKSRCCNVCHETITRVNELKVNLQKIPQSSIPIVSALKKRQNQHTQKDSTLKSDTENQPPNESAALIEIEPIERKATRTKSVRFSDGIIPGVDIPDTEETGDNSLDLSGKIKAQRQSCKRNRSNSYLSKKYKVSSKSTRQNRYIEDEIIGRVKLHQIVNNILPPIYLNDEIIDSATLDEENYLIKEKLLSNEFESHLTFLLLKNLKVHVRVVNRNLFFGWMFITQGLCANGQDEIMIMVKFLPDEKSIPRQIFYHILDIYERSLKGFRVTSMNYVLYDFDSVKNAKDSKKHESEPGSDTSLPKEISYLFGNKENVGFLYFRPTTYHNKCCFKKMKDYLPAENFLIGCLVQKWEIPWVKLFPLRLCLRLGERFNVYPCPIVNDRDRKAVFGEIGNTILSLLCDVRNFQYTIAQIDGLSIKLEGSNTKILIPESQYDFVIKSLLTSNEYVFSLAQLQLDDKCSSHLVAIENENLSTYTSKTMSFNQDKQNETGEKVVGAAFVVFNGALKPNLTLNAKQSIIEDGIMIQIEPETLTKLKLALQQMKPYYLVCNKQTQTMSKPVENTISIEWIKDGHHINRNVFSIIDGRSLCGVKSIKLTNSYDYVNEMKSIRWCEVFLMQIEEEENSPDGNFNLNAFAEMCAQACCTALVPLLNELENKQRNYLTRKIKKLDSKQPCLNKTEIEEDNDSTDENFEGIIDPFKIGLRVQVNKFQVGYLIGMNGMLINQEKYLTSLDNEIIQILHHVNSSNINILLEFVFYIQERFNCDNTYLYVNRHQQR